MIDPKRWLDADSEGTDLEQTLLRAGVDNEIPAGTEAAVWSALSARLDGVPPDDSGSDAGPSGPGDGGASGASHGGGAGGAGAAMGPGAATGAGGAAISGAAKLMMLSAFGVGAMVGAGIAGITASLDDERKDATAIEATAPSQAGRAPRNLLDNANHGALRSDVPAAPLETDDPAPQGWDLSPTHPTPSGGSGASVTPPSGAEYPLTGAPLGSPPNTTQATPAPVPPSPAAPGPSVAAFTSVQDTGVPSARYTAEQRQSQLREEAAVLRQAREALRRSDLAGAFAALEVARTRFPGGALIQEREALTIELLARSGQMDAAHQRADAFLRAHPSSAHAARVRDVLKRP